MSHVYLICWVFIIHSLSQSNIDIKGRIFNEKNKVFSLNILFRWVHDSILKITIIIIINLLPKLLLSATAKKTQDIIYNFGSATETFPDSARHRTKDGSRGKQREVTLYNEDHCNSLSVQIMYSLAFWREGQGPEAVITSMNIKITRYLH